MPPIRFHCIVLLPIVVLLTLANTRSNTILVDARITARFPASTSDARSGRLLRAHPIEYDENDGERGFTSSAIEKAKSWLAPSTVTEKMLQGWLDSEKSADTIFSWLKLTKAGDNLFDNPQFPTWIKYVDDLNLETPEKATSPILTLTTQYGDEALVAMLETAKRVSSTEMLATRLQAEQVRYWLDIGKPPGDVLRLLKLDKVGGNLLTNKGFATWIAYVDNFNAKHPEGAISMVSTLTKFYGDARLFKMVESAKKSKETESIATKLQTEQLQQWLRDGKSPGYALVTFGLGKATDDLLENPLLNIWVKYMNDFNRKYPKEKTTMIQTFTRRYGDWRLATIILAAKNVEKTTSMAANLETAQLQRWIRSGKSTDDVFKLLKLHKEGETLFSNPLLSTWTSYMRKFNQENPTKQSSLFTTLTNNFDDIALFKILEAGKVVPSMESTATKLLSQQYQEWLSSNVHPTKVFKFMGLDKVGETVLTTPQFKTWFGYLNTFNKENPNNQASLFTSLHANSYMHFQMDRIVDVAMANPSTVEIAKMVLAGRFKRWMDDDRTPQVVFAYFYLNSAGDTLLSSPKFEWWVKYLNEYNHRFPDKKANMIDAMTKYYYNKPLVRILTAAKKDPRTEKMATNLQNELLDKWVTAQKKPEDVAMFLPKEASDPLMTTYKEKLKLASGTAA